MKTWIILLRGINVGGNNIIKMQDLRDLLTKADYQNVRTYIQSGNIAFESDISNADQVNQHIQSLIKASHGFAPNTMAIPVSMLVKIIAGNPYPDAIETPKNLHVSFLARKPANPNISALNALKTEHERFSITSNAAYFHLPEGIWKSKLATQFEKHIGVPATARNWRSVQKLLELANK